MKPYDVVVDGTDNFLLVSVNDACVMLNKPNATARFSALKAKQQYLTTKVAPLPRSLPRTTTARNGSLLCRRRCTCVLCGIIGTIQATEVIKIILGQKYPSGRLMLYNALEMKFAS